VFILSRNRLHSLGWSTAALKIHGRINHSLTKFEIKLLTNGGSLAKKNNLLSVFNLGRDRLFIIGPSTAALKLHGLINHNLAKFKTVRRQFSEKQLVKCVYSR